MSKEGDLIVMMYDSECTLRRIPPLVEAVYIRAIQGRADAASEMAAQVAKEVIRVADALGKYNEHYVAERDKPLEPPLHHGLSPQAGQS